MRHVAVMRITLTVEGQDRKTAERLVCKLMGHTTRKGEQMGVKVGLADARVEFGLAPPTWRERVREFFGRLAGWPARVINRCGRMPAQSPGGCPGGSKP